MGVDAVAREAAAHLVVDAALRHLAQGERREVERLAIACRRESPQQELERIRVREFWRAGEAAAIAIERRGEVGLRVVERRARELRRMRGRSRRAARERLRELLALRANIVGMLVVEFAHALQQ